VPNNIDQQTPYLQSGNPRTENRLPDNYSAGQLGSRFTFVDTTVSPNRAKGYQLVQADSVLSTATFEGAVAWWVNRAAYTVTTDPANRGQIAGVFQTIVTAGYICCVQQSGPSTVKVTTGTPAVTGNFAVPSATAATADAIALGTAATHPILGLFQSVATDNFATVELQVPGQP
jgi:hypothetical protein